MPNSEWWKADDTTRANARDKHPPMESLPYCTQYNGTADNSTFPQKRLKCWDTVGRDPVWAVYVHMCVCVCVCVSVREASAMGLYVREECLLDLMFRPPPPTLFSPPCTGRGKRRPFRHPEPR